MPLIPILIAALIAFGGGTAALADSAKPGNFLYPVDQWVERFQERVTWSEEAKAALLTRFSEERLQELQSLLSVDPTQLKEKAQALWEQHREDATEHLAASIERANAVKDRFEEKLEGADEEDATKFQKVIDTMDEIIARREQRMEEVESKQFPGIGQVPLRQQVRAWLQKNKAEMDEVREQVKEEFGDETPGLGTGKQEEQGSDEQSSTNPAIAYPPYQPGLGDDIQMPEELIETQKELQQKLAELGKQLAEKLKDVFSKPSDPAVNPKFPPPPQLM